jgi:hypothetical protein
MSSLSLTHWHVDGKWNAHQEAPMTQLRTAGKARIDASTTRIIAFTGFDIY